MFQASAADAAGADQLLLDADFPGGNIIVDRFEGDDVSVRQDLRDTQGDWFFWHFRVRGAAGRALAFHFAKGNVIGVLGPAVSADGGGTWAWLGREAVQGPSFRYVFAADAREVRFCFAIPYLESHFRKFLKPYANSPHVRSDTLCETRKGRGVERLWLGRLDGGPEHRVLVTCRHHCCESMANYALEGVVEAALADSDDGQWFRQHVELLAVPFVDKDGVEDGDQGKNRRPHDHNRDYSGESLYPAVKAIRDFVPKWAAGRLRVALDLHCPHIRGPHNEVIYLVGSPATALWDQQCEFGRILESVQAGPLLYRAADNLPFGKEWNTESNYRTGKSLSRWAGELPGVRLSATIEIPYANAAGRTVTADSARGFGRDLARALRRYLES